MISTREELFREAEALAEAVTKADAETVAADQAYQAAMTAYDERTSKIILDEKARGDTFARAWAFINTGAEHKAVAEAGAVRSAAMIRFFDLERRFKIALARASQWER